MMGPRAAGMAPVHLRHFAATAAGFKQIPTSTRGRGRAEQSMTGEFRSARDVDWGLLAPLLVHVVFPHGVVGVVRVTISYRTIELGLPVVWLGVISAGFAILPIFTAVQIGRYIDRGHDAHAGWMGSALMLAACLGL